MAIVQGIQVPDTTPGGLPDIGVKALPANAWLLWKALTARAQVADGAQAWAYRGRKGVKVRLDVPAVEEELWPALTRDPDDDASADAREELRRYLTGTVNAVQLSPTPRPGLWWVADTWSGHQAGIVAEPESAVADDVPRVTLTGDLILDMVAVMQGEKRLHSETIVRRLAGNRPVTYQSWTPQKLGRVMKREYGVETTPFRDPGTGNRLNGFSRDDLAQAAAARTVPLPDLSPSASALLRPIISYITRLELDNAGKPKEAESSEVTQLRADLEADEIEIRQLKERIAELEAEAAANKGLVQAAIRFRENTRGH